MFIKFILKYKKKAVCNKGKLKKFEDFNSSNYSIVFKKNYQKSQIQLKRNKFIYM